MHMCVDMTTALYTYVLLNFFMVSYCSGFAKKRNEKQRGKHENPSSFNEDDM